MPFSDEMRDVYSDIIKPHVVSLGHSCVRADDIKNNRNLMRNVLEGIKNADMIICDITENNANVLYEMAIADMLGIPVLIISQSLSEAPFDIKTYRIIEYSRDYRSIERLKNEIIDSLEDIEKDIESFGSPASDYLGIKIRKYTTHDELDFLDILTNLEESFDIMNSGSEKFVAIMNNMTEETKNLNEYVQKHKSSNSKISALRNRFRIYAISLGKYALEIDEIRDNYDKMSIKFERGLTFVLKTGSMPEENKKQYDELIESLMSMVQTLEYVCSEFRDLVNVSSSMRGIEKNLSDSQSRFASSMNKYIFSIENIKSLCERMALSS